MAFSYRYQVAVNADGRHVHVCSFGPAGELLFERSSRCGLAQISPRISQLAEAVLRNEATPAEHAQLGGLLFAAIFTDEAAFRVRESLVQVRNTAREQGQNEQYVRVELALDDEASAGLAALPWELLSVPSGNTVSDSAADIVVVRRLHDARPMPAPPPLAGPLRLQFVTANAGIGRERERVIEQLPLPPALRPSCLPTLPSNSAAELQAALVDGRPHLLHLVVGVRARVSADGGVRGELSLDPVQDLWLGPRELGTLFTAYQPRLTVIEAVGSHGATHQAALRGIGRVLARSGVACVLMLPSGLAGDDRTRFLSDFYTRIGRFEPADLAAHAGRRLLASSAAPQLSHLALLALHSDDSRLVAPHPDLVAQVAALRQPDLPKDATSDRSQPAQRIVGDTTPHRPPFVRVPEQLALPDLMARLSSEGRQALAFALGEALRIGQFWLGLEFLLMGLSRQTGTALPNLLAELKVDPSDTFRGGIRGVAGSIVDPTWRKRDPEQMGVEALPRLRMADGLVSGSQPPLRGDPIITPRMVLVLRQAAALAGDRPISHAHLLLAAMQHPNAAPVEWLFALAHDAGWSADKIRQRLAALHDSPLDTIGSDLCAAARDGRLPPLVGATHRHIVAQLVDVIARAGAPHPLIIGARGVGKRSVIEGLAARLVDADASLPPRLVGRHLVLLPAANIVADHRSAGDLTPLFERLIEAAQITGPRTLIAVDSIDALLTVSNEFTSLLRTTFNQRQYTYIATIEPEAYHRHITEDPQFAAFFTPIWLEEPAVDEAIAIVGALCEQWLRSRYGVRFAPEVPAAAVELAMRFPRGQRLPGRAIEIVEQVARPIAARTADEQREPEIDRRTLIDGVAAAEGVSPALLADEGAQLRMLHSQLAPLVSDAQATRMVDIIGAAGVMGLRRPRAVLMLSGASASLARRVGQVLAHHTSERGDQLMMLDLRHARGALLADDLSIWLRRAANSVLLLEGVDAASAAARQAILSLCRSGRIVDSRGVLVDGQRSLLILTAAHWAGSPATGFMSPAGYDEIEIDLVVEIGA